MTDDFKIWVTPRSDNLTSSLNAIFDEVHGLDFDVKKGNLAALAPELLNGAAPHLLLIDMSFRDPGELAQLSQIIKSKRGQLAVVATAEEADMDAIRTLMRIGVSDFLPQPLRKEDVLNAVQVVRQNFRGAESRGGAVISFIKSCGGVGATTLAVQTAADLLHRTKKERNKVCLLDFDLQFGNIAFSLDLETDVGISQIIENVERSDDDFIFGVVSHHSSGIDVVSAPKTIIPLEVMTAETAGHIISWARRHYNYVVVDMPMTWTSWTASVLKASHKIMLVTEVGVSGVQRCQRHFDLLMEQHLDDIPLSVIANRYKSSFGTKHFATEAEKALGRKIDCFVREDASTAKAAQEQGVLLQDVKKRSKIEKDLHGFLQKVRQEIAVTGDVEAKEINLHKLH
jgi:pilus assembly protein CpaE